MVVSSNGGSAVNSGHRSRHREQEGTQGRLRTHREMRHPQGRKPVFIGLRGHGGAEEEAVWGKEVGYKPESVKTVMREIP